MEIFQFLIAGISASGAGALMCWAVVAGDIRRARMRRRLATQHATGVLS